MSQSKAVFVDHSGRRRKVAVAAVIILGAIVLTLTVTLINGVVSDTRLPGISWPGGQPAGQPAATPSAAPAPSASPSPDRSVKTSEPATPTARATPSRRAASPSRTPPASRSSTPKPSPSDTAEPSPTDAPTGDATTDAPNPGHGGTPPGHARKP